MSTDQVETVTEPQVETVTEPQVETVTEPQVETVTEPQVETRKSTSEFLTGITVTEPITLSELEKIYNSLDTLQKKKEFGKIFNNYKDNNLIIAEDHELKFEIPHTLQSTFVKIHTGK